MAEIQHKRFKNRLEAGQILAGELTQFKEQDPVILAIPRGGVPVGYAIAQNFRAPLEVVVPRKLPIPHEPEAGFGAVTIDGTIVLNQPLIDRLALSRSDIEGVASTVLEEVKRRTREYRGDRPYPELKGRTVLLVDDGLASGYTMIAAAKWVRKNEPGRVVVAVPVAPVRSVHAVSPYVDEIICRVTVSVRFFAVASFYEEFEDLSDEEVKRYLDLVAVEGSA